METDKDLIDQFYRSIIKKIMDRGIISKNDQILVCCGGEKDRATLLSLNLENVTISNLDTRLKNGGEKKFAPYQWSFQDVENLEYGDNEFALCIVHSGLHHCINPQRAILEMYRVSSKAIIAFEPHKSLFTRIGVKLGFGQQYEHGAVQANNLLYGGVANTHIPNFVYRFNKEMIHNTIQCGNPVAQHKIECWYATRIPGRLQRLKNPVAGIVIKYLKPILEWLGKTSGFLANNFAFMLLKPDLPEELMPWLKMTKNGITADEKWFDIHYK